MAAPAADRPMVNTPRDQVIGLTKFLFNQARATVAQPVPSMPNWVGGQRANIRAAHRALALDVAGLQEDELEATLPCLVMYCRQFSRLPNLTRTILSELDIWLSHDHRNVKSGLIAEAYPNVEGDQGGIDNFVSVCSFVSEMQLGGEMMTQRLLAGQYWLAAFDKMRAELSKVRTLVPKIQLRKAEPSELVKQSEVLINSQETFWNAYKTWLDCNLTDDQMRQIRTVFPGLDLHRDRTFVQQCDTVRTSDWHLLWCSNDDPHLNPDNIPGLSAIWRDIQGTLTAVGQCCSNYSDKSTSTVTVIMEDFNSLIKQLTLERHLLDFGTRESFIHEVKELSKRINYARENGYAVEESVRVTMMNWHSSLLQDKNEADKLVREEEAIRKAHATEAAKLAPKVQLMKLTGFSTFLGWNHQCSTILDGIKTEQAKISLIYQSLSVDEDKKHLRGVTSLNEILVYIKAKYNRPHQLVGSVLKIGYDLKPPGTCKKSSKANCLTVLEIRRDLRKYRMQAKIDLFFINTIAPKCLTDDDYSRYLRARDRDDKSHNEAKKRLEDEKARALLHSTRVPGDATSVEDDLEEADRARKLDDVDDDSDCDTKILSIVEHLPAMDTDPMNKRARKFFFEFVEEVLSSIRSWEAHTNQTTSNGGGNGGGGGKGGGKGNKSLPTTLNFNTDAEGMSCILTSCNKKHKNKSGKPTKSLIHCSHFCDLKLHEKNRIIKAAHVCTKCLCSGHKQAQCNSTLCCTKCGSETHHALVCRSNGKSDKGEKPKPSKPKDTSTIVRNTVVEDTTEADGSSDSTVEELPETTNHKLEVFSMTEVEVFQVGKDMPADRQHTCVGSVNLKVKNYSTKQLCLFDNCSSDHWVLESLAKKMGAKQLPPWEGFVRTMMGRERKRLPVYEFQVRQVDGNFISIQAFGTDDIGTKPSIDRGRYDRLMKAFKLKPEQVENPSGTIGLMIGLKSQRLMSHKVKSLFSPSFPDVGVYESSACEKLIFVGASESQMTETKYTTCHMTSALESTLKNFLDSEGSITLNENQCDFCYDNRGCTSCRHMQQPRTYQQMTEDVIIRKAIQVLPVDGETNKYKLMCEYPIKSDVNLAYIYDVNRSNRKMAVASSLALRKRLEKDGKLLAFHDKVSEGINKGQYRIINDEVEKEYAGLPQSFQLVNYVVKETSATTKIRVVSNSSVHRQGGSFNDLCVQGSSLLNSSLDVLNSFSCWGYSFLTDLSEAYRTVETGPITNSCRRFCWFSDPLNPDSLQDLHLTVCNYGDRPAGNILAQSLDTVASDPETPDVVAEFIKKSFYVDDAGRSARTIARLEEIIDELGPAMGKYGFRLKHILRSYQTNVSTGSTSTESVETILGLLWSFLDDTLLPNFKVYLGKKRRGEHLDQILDLEVLARTTFTMRVVLRAVGCLYDLSGRFLSPVQMKGRSLYSQVAKLTSKWDQNLMDIDPGLCVKIEDFFKELCEIQEKLKPMARSWVPKEHDMKMLITSEDGSIEGYSATMHVRSQCPTTKRYISNLATARNKVSQLDVGDNELSSMLLGGKMAEQTIKSIPDLPDGIPFVHMGDSQCSAHTLNPAHLQTDRRRRNILVKLHRVFRRIHATYPSSDILFVWAEGSENVADLNSKSHPNLLEIVNGQFWRHGPPSFSSEIFPPPNYKVYARYTKGCFYFDGLGLSETDIHMTNCQNSVCRRTDTGPLTAGKLVSHAKSLSPELADETADSDQLMLAVGQDREPAASQLTGADSGDASRSGGPVLMQSGLSTDQPAQSADGAAVRKPVQYAQPSREIMKRFSNISGFCKAARNLIACVRPDTHRSLQLLRIWWAVLQQSQAQFPPKQCKQQMLTTVRGVLGTRARMTSHQLVMYHKLPASILPAVSQEDELLMQMLFEEAHVTGNGIHLNKDLTLLKLRTGFFGVHVAAAAKLIKRLIANCVSCKSHQARLEVTEIGEKFGLAVTRAVFGIFSAISIDILGPYRFKSGQLTRANQPRKCWILMAVCHQTSACNFEYMVSYSEQSLLDALKAHAMNTRRPRMVSSDAGSQIKSAARRATRSSARIAEELSSNGQVLITQTNEQGGMKSWACMLDTLKSKFVGDVSWFIAPPGCQSMNGLCEGNVRIMKTLLKNHLKTLTLEGYVFESFLSLQYSFTSVKHVMNTRPVYYSEERVVTAHDLMFPSFTNNDEEAGSLKNIVDYTDAAFKMFCELHDQHIVSGRYLRFGSKVPDKASDIKVNDFVMVTGASKAKYGIIQEILSKHRMSVRMLQKRSKSGDGPISNSIVGIGSIVHLYSPPKKGD